MSTITVLSDNNSFEPFQIFLQEEDGASSIYSALEDKIPVEHAQLRRDNERPYDFSNKFQDGEVVRVYMKRQWEARLEEFEPFQFGGMFIDIISYDKPRVVGYKFYFSILDENGRKLYLMVYYYKKSKKFYIEKMNGTAFFLRKEMIRNPHRGFEWRPTQYTTLREALVDQAELNHIQINDMIELSSVYPPFVYDV